MGDTSAAVKRFLAGHRAAAERQRRLIERRGSLPEQAVRECLDVLAALEESGWPSSGDPVQVRDVRRVRALWATVKREYRSGAKG